MRWLLAATVFGVLLVVALVDLVPGVVSQVAVPPGPRLADRVRPWAVGRLLQRLGALLVVVRLRLVVALSPQPPHQPVLAVLPVSVVLRRLVGVAPVVSALARDGGGLLLPLCRPFALLLQPQLTPPVLSLLQSLQQGAMRLPLSDTTPATDRLGSRRGWAVVPCAVSRPGGTSGCGAWATSFYGPERWVAPGGSRPKGPVLPPFLRGVFAAAKVAPTGLCEGGRGGLSATSPLTPWASRPTRGAARSGAQRATGLGPGRGGCGGRRGTRGPTVATLATRAALSVRPGSRRRTTPMPHTRRAAVARRHRGGAIAAFCRTRGVGGPVPTTGQPPGRPTTTVRATLVAPGRCPLSTVEEIAGPHLEQRLLPLPVVQPVALAGPLPRQP